MASARQSAGFGLWLTVTACVRGNLRRSCRAWQRRALSCRPKTRSSDCLGPTVTGPRATACRAAGWPSAAQTGWRRRSRSAEPTDPFRKEPSCCATAMGARSKPCSVRSRSAPTGSAWLRGTHSTWSRHRKTQRKASGYASGSMRIGLLCHRMAAQRPVSSTCCGGLQPTAIRSVSTR